MIGIKSDKCKKLSSIGISLGIGIPSGVVFLFLANFIGDLQLVYMRIMGQLILHGFVMGVFSCLALSKMLEGDYKKDKYSKIIIKLFWFFSLAGTIVLTVISIIFPLKGSSVMGWVFIWCSIVYSIQMIEPVQKAERRK